MSAQPWTSADGRVSLYVGDSREVLRGIADASVDAVVCDPPYELGFMGRKWDASGIAYDVDLWREVARVMKPGAHLLAFGGTRTHHRMTCAIEDAGLEIRDCIAWIYGSGFPKSLDVSKAIDKSSGETRDRKLRFTAWMRSTGITIEQINTATNSAMGSHYLTDKSQPAIATADMFELLRPHLPEVPEEIERLVAERTGIEWTAYKRREVVAHRSARLLSGHLDVGSTTAQTIIADTAPATDAARQWQGWGTALKPAHEPIVVARKPLDGTVANNVITHGTGAINVDGCRVAYTQETELGDLRMAGRWPANVALDEEAAQGMGEPSRYFYTAKASTSEREQGLAHRTRRKVSDGREATADNPRLRAETMRGNTHPTVKPIDLMRWLCRLVTPPDGLILDPFAGSGSTLIAAHAEGFRALGVELDEEHASIARDRLGGHASLFVGLR